MTIAQQLNVKEFPFIIKDSKGNEIYREGSIGYWYKREYDSRGNQIYYEDSTGFWIKSEWDSNGKEIYREDSDGKIVDNRPKDIVLKNSLSRLGTPVATRSTGYWIKSEYDSQGKEIYYEDSNGSWSKKEYDSCGNEIYWENSQGIIVDKRPKDIVLTIDEIAQRLNIPVSQLKIKK